MSLFARDVVVCALSSGSSGNCTYIGDGHAGVLIDCGVSTKQTRLRMAEQELADAPIDAVLVTHEHADHVGAAGVLSRALAKRGRPVPFFMTEGTRAALPPQCVPDGVELVKAGKSFRVRHFRIDAMPIPHDTKDPVAYRVHVGDTTIAVVTDLGKPTQYLTRQLAECDAIVMEFNHDEAMLMEGSYPWHLKQRIRSPHGHLSNEQARQLLAGSLSPRLRHLMLAHLSDENNTPQKALAAANLTLREAGATGEVRVQIARQRASIPAIRVRTRSW